MQPHGAGMCDPVQVISMRTQSTGVDCVCLCLPACVCACVCVCVEPLLLQRQGCVDVLPDREARDWLHVLLYAHVHRRPDVLCRVGQPVLAAHDDVPRLQLVPVPQLPSAHDGLVVKLQLQLQLRRWADGSTDDWRWRRRSAPHGLRRRRRLRPTCLIQHSGVCRVFLSFLQLLFPWPAEICSESPKCFVLHCST